MIEPIFWKKILARLVKKEVLTVYISQFALIAVALFCCIVPLFSESAYLTGWKAITGLCILASVFYCKYCLFNNTI